MKAFIIAGLGFGDEGKGSLTDALTRRYNAELVVRYNGGAQAGHNVVTPDGRHHCFAQFGAGTFAGARTFLSRFMLVNPIFAQAEAKHLEAVGVSHPFDGMSVDTRALVTTPYHVAANRLRELARGEARHGSCGMGIGETRALERTNHALYMFHLADKGRSLALHLRGLREHFRAELESLRHLDSEAARREWDILDDESIIDSTFDVFRSFAGVVDVVDDFKVFLRRRAPRTIIYEGAQGFLLDETNGFQPHTTWTNCTFANANQLLFEGGKLDERDVTRIGVTRTYLTRHGAGPFPTEGEAGIDVFGDHNTTGPWQGDFRTGALDLVLLRYALRSSCRFAFDRPQLFVSHVDQAIASEDGYGSTTWALAVAHEHEHEDSAPRPRPDPATARPRYVYTDADEKLPSVIASLLDVQLFGWSEGPTARDKHFTEDT